MTLQGSMTALATPLPRPRSVVHSISDGKRQLPSLPFVPCASQLSSESSSSDLTFGAPLYSTSSIPGCVTR